MCPQKVTGCEDGEVRPPLHICLLSFTFPITQTNNPGWVLQKRCEGGSEGDPTTKDTNFNQKIYSSRQSPIVSFWPGNAWTYSRQTESGANGPSTRLQKYFFHQQKFSKYFISKHKILLVYLLNTFSHLAGKVTQEMRCGKGIPKFRLTPQLNCPKHGLMKILTEINFQLYVHLWLWSLWRGHIIQGDPV